MSGPPHAVEASFRPATKADVPSIVALLADDPLGAQRERSEEPLPASYLAAFESIDADPNNHLLVGDIDGTVVAVMQLTFIPYLTYRGSWRALAEGIRVASSLRGHGLGRRLLEHGIELAQQRGCHLLQLTTDKARPEALAFYESLGFESTHHGMKLHFNE